MLRFHRIAAGENHQRYDKLIYVNNLSFLFPLCYYSLILIKHLTHNYFHYKTNVCFYNSPQHVPIYKVNIKLRWFNIKDGSFFIKW
jgi:hypothetical protein